MTYGFTDILTLLGSLALFLYGMKVMSDALMELAGDKMRKILAAATSNRFLALLTGLFITTAIQSSSATTLMVVSFVNASLLTLTEAVGVIMGANIGTTVTAWLISILGFKVKMSAIALPLVGFGFLLSLSKLDQRRHWGFFLIGFSVLFIGLQFLKDSVPDIKDNPEILSFLQQYTNLGYLSVLLFLAIGTILTLIIQSSSATMALTLLMTHEGWIPFDMAAAMVLGENIGTTITANLAAFVANFNAKRAARAHLIFNLLGVVWMLLLFYPFIQMIGYVAIKLGGQSPFLTAAAIPVALSLFHTGFNFINSALLIGFIPQIVRVVERLIPGVPEEEIEVGLVPATWHLDESQISHPAFAIELAQTEISRMSKIIARMLRAVVHPFTFDEPGEDEIYPKLTILEGIEMREEKIDFLDEKVVDYLVQIGRQELSNKQMSEVYAMISIANDMENIGDIIHRNLVPLATKRLQLESDFSKEGKAELITYHEKVSKQMSRLRDALGEMDPAMAKKILRKEEKYEILESDFRIRHVKRLHAEKEKSIETHEVHVEFMDLIKQVGVHLANIAKTIKEVNVGEEGSELEV
ncbi:MAG: Na/Pi cotransporter family protein [Candidatus Marinimicrobia bacterium]|jgi:phosphate:Na+ symporter|nr:Na/Pi cotransporter family protein [Candidatus Neomarinimicrobiota bacterium]MDP6965846.1 Na/Pi cotransporter family protein [Candidatus Neomarinimicrobiota bacterium]|tara:strand:+ start:502 stop:2250 length:1749 start_codon:yes stop_codon:yes gene_type:complete